MITASQELKDLFYESRTVNIGAGCIVEYNMNLMLDNIVANYDETLEESYTKTEDGRINVFKKLFPIDSIVKPFRPINSGIKHYVSIDSDNQGQNRFYDYRTVPYPATAPRVYYAGVTNAYKYWVTPQDTGVNVTVKYSQDTIDVIEAYSTGSKVVYKTSTNHGLNIGKRVTITGSGNSNYNLVNQVVTAVPDAKTFSVSYAMAQSSITGVSKTATVVDQAGVAKPTKPALANKIVLKFEKYHSLPSTCNFTINYFNGSQDTLSSVSVPSNGSVIIYYNGTSWSTSPSYSSSQAISLPAPKEIKSITVTTPSAGSEKIIGLVEISARWVKDLSSDLIEFTISKESSSDSRDILPVGNITANSLSLNLSKYDSSNLLALTYNRDEDWTTTPTPNDAIYLAKNAEFMPYFKVFHADGQVTEGSQRYDRVWQGSFLLDSHSISEYGDIEINALDGAKHLMETLIPDLFYRDAPATSVIMSVLDSIGFTNYNMNILLDESGKSIDKSIPTLAMWWSEKNKTVWNCIQELCRDIQMNAFFDENNVLQFYTRDYLYSKEDVDWSFYYDQSGDNLPNIVEFTKEELPSANQVKILWKTPMSSLYTQTATDLWAAEPSFLISGGLRQEILATTPAENVVFDLDIDNLDPFVKFESTFNYSGYFLVDSEIFEYDAIQFSYEPIDSIVAQNVWVSSEADWAQYRSLSKTGSEYFKPTGKYRIKNRGVFGTEKSYHPATKDVVSGWYQINEDEWD